MSLSALLIASTILYRDRIASETPYKPHPFPSFEETVMAADELTEFAARSVHGSWRRSDPNTERNDDYLAHLKALGEMSYFEHSHATFWVTGASLALSLELRPYAGYLTITEASLRHRALDSVYPTVPAAITYEEEVAADLHDAFEIAQQDAQDAEAALRRQGFPASSARDGALAFLPLSTETSMVITGDMVAWPFLIQEAFKPDTSAEFFELGSHVLRQLRQMAPNAVRGIVAIRESRPDEIEAAPLEEYTECG